MTQIVNRQLEPYSCSLTCLRQAGVNAIHCIRHAHCPPRVNRPLKLHKRCTCCLCVKVGMLAGPLFIGCPYFRNYIRHNSDYLAAATVCRCVCVGCFAVCVGVCMYAICVKGGPPHLLPLATRVDQHRWRVSLDMRRAKTKCVQVANLV